MRALLQRVTGASVEADRQVIGSIDRGLVTLLGVAAGDGPDDVRYLADKILHLRIFEDEQGKFQHSLLDTGGGCLLVSQFTLLANTRRGRRPDFLGAAAPEVSRATRDGGGRAASWRRCLGRGGPVRRAHGGAARQRWAGDDLPGLARARGMKGGAAASPAPPLVDEFLERLRVEDGSSPLTIAAYRRDLGAWSIFSAPGGERSRPRGPTTWSPTSRRSAGTVWARARSHAGSRRCGASTSSGGAPTSSARTPPRSSRRRGSRAGSRARSRSGTRPRWWSRPGDASPSPGGIARCSSCSTDPDCARPSSSASGRRTWTSRPRSSSAAASATGSGWSRSGDAARRALVTYLERARPRLVRGADPGVLFVNARGRASRPPGPLADRADPRPGCGPPRRVPARAPPLVREPSPRGRRRSPVGPGPARTRRHRDDRDLHAPAHRRRAPALPHVPPASVRMERRGGPETTASGMSGSAAVPVRRTSYPQVDPRARGLMRPGLVVVPPDVTVALAARLANRRQARLVAAASAAPNGRPRRRRPLRRALGLWPPPGAAPGGSLGRAARAREGVRGRGPAAPRARASLPPRRGSTPSPRASCSGSRAQPPGSPCPSSASSTGCLDQ